MRYLTCWRCGLKVTTEERFAVSWIEEAMVAQVKALLPEGQAVALVDKGITGLPLARLNARLLSLGYIIHAGKGRDPKQLAVRTGEDGRVELFGLFELQHPVPAGATVVLGADDTVERRSRRQITAKGCYRNAVRSTKQHVVHCYGLKWVSMLPPVPMPLLGLALTSGKPLEAGQLFLRTP